MKYVFTISVKISTNSRVLRDFEYTVSEFAVRAVFVIFPLRKIGHFKLFILSRVTPKPIKKESEEEEAESESKVNPSAQAEMSMLRFDQPKNFKFEPKDWPLWKENFERYHIASGLAKLSEDEQINALVYVMGLKANNIFKSFTFFRDKDAKKYATVLKKFEITRSEPLLPSLLPSHPRGK